MTGDGKSERGVMAVGVDGSTGAAEALRWAAAEAHHLRQARCGSSTPETYAFPGAGSGGFGYP
jgi:hypothetical protein